MEKSLATDGSDASLSATEAVAEMKFPQDAEVKVVSVIHPIIYSLEEIGFSRGKESERAHRAIVKTVNLLRNAPLKISAEVVAGWTVRQILARAREWNADLIVVGSEERTGMKRLMSRGTVVAVANRAHCPVRMVRRNNGPQHEQRPPGGMKSEQDLRAENGLGSLSNAA